MSDLAYVSGYITVSDFLRPSWSPALRITMDWSDPQPVRGEETITVPLNLTAVYPINDTGIVDYTRPYVDPLVSIPTDVTIDGVDAQAAPLAGISETATFAWTPPSLGPATDYDVEIFRLFIGTAATRMEPVVTLHSLSPRATVLPGFLDPGETYVARITAWSVPNVDRRVHRQMLKLPFGKAQVATQVFTIR